MKLSKPPMRDAPPWVFQRGHALPARARPLRRPSRGWRVGEGERWERSAIARPGGRRSSRERVRRAARPRDGRWRRHDCAKSSSRASAVDSQMASAGQRCCGGVRSASLGDSSSAPSSENSHTTGIRNTSAWSSPGAKGEADMSRYITMASALDARPCHPQSLIPGQNSLQPLRVRRESRDARTREPRHLAARPVAGRGAQLELRGRLDRVALLKALAEGRRDRTRPQNVGASRTHWPATVLGSAPPKIISRQAYDEGVVLVHRRVSRTNRSCT